MRTSRRVKQKLYYSLYIGKTETYVRDESGSIIYDIIGGDYVPRKTGEPISTYALPVLFFNSISGQLTEDEMKAFGGEKIGTAKMTYRKNEFPIDTGTLIWKNTAPKYIDNETVDEESADYVVLGVLDAGKHFWKCILAENAKTTVQE